MSLSTKFLIRNSEIWRKYKWIIIWKKSELESNNSERKKGLTQEQLAENLDITAGTIGKIEIGRTGISIDLLICMSDFFEVPTDYIILGKKSDMHLLKGEIHNIIVKLEEIEKSM